MAEIDISTRLGEEDSYIKVAEGKRYKVNKSAKNYILVQQKMSGTPTIETMYEMIKMLLGEEAYKEIEEMDLTINKLYVLITGISALIAEVSYEEMEKRFQKSK